MENIDRILEAGRLETLRLARVHSLVSLSPHLLKLGHREEAIKTNAEGVNIYCPLIERLGRRVHRHGNCGK
jgi:hypothetical protein